MRPRAWIAVAAGIVALVSGGCDRDTGAERDYVESLMEWRTAKDRHLQSPEGPLTEAQRPRFKGLAYYPPRLALVFEVRLEAAAVADTMRFATSGEGFDLFLRAGLVRFQHGGREHALTLFESLEDGHLFLPFTDATSGKQTYGAGRYLDPEVLPDGRLRLDFNRAYSPYCAYNAQWICPLPPPSNRLDFAVEAGERDFPYGH
jgi:hypothetical protein